MNPANRIFNALTILKLPCLSYNVKFMDLSKDLVFSKNLNFK